MDLITRKSPSMSNQILLSDLENFDKKRKKAKLKAEISGYVARWRHYRFAPVDAVERACIWLAEEDIYSC